MGGCYSSLFHFRGHVRWWDENDECIGWIILWMAYGWYLIIQRPWAYGWMIVSACCIFKAVSICQMELLNCCTFQGALVNGMKKTTGSWMDVTLISCILTAVFVHGMKKECIGWHLDGWYLQLGAFSEHMDGWYHTNFAFFIGALVNKWKRRVHWMDNIMSLLQFSRARLLIGWKRRVNWMDDILSLIDFTRPASMLRFRENKTMAIVERAPPMAHTATTTMESSLLDDGARRCINEQPRWFTPTRWLTALVFLIFFSFLFWRSPLFFLWWLSVIGYLAKL
jgi:hypothetical protein